MVTSSFSRSSLGLISGATSEHFSVFFSATQDVCCGSFSLLWKPWTGTETELSDTEHYVSLQSTFIICFLLWPCGTDSDAGTLQQMQWSNWAASMFFFSFTELMWPQKLWFSFISSDHISLCDSSSTEPTFIQKVLIPNHRKIFFT